ncbi:hypothetical protein Goshw_027744 [Gossypium schwendimanii]|uniref:Uncharacterized protein n=4 Tax=Gossypium TaxID=3633 RepID=A0A7J9FI58_9ROSI|nr:hypothetical protein [Gossypium klotzschianum]MBA0784927.1 hypothetical protein [Gossypium trilobum]MBA0790246.1 hypothetical protein [Gossypium harknessii]MBA0848063.1 hypothetical protein [Gossypium schwendimanii]
MLSVTSLGSISSLARSWKILFPPPITVMFRMSIVLTTN